MVLPDPRQPARGLTAGAEPDKGSCSFAGEQRARCVAEVQVCYTTTFSLFKVFLSDVSTTLDTHAKQQEQYKEIEHCCDLKE